MAPGSRPRPGRHVMFVFNGRFLPRGHDRAYLYGVVQHVLHMADMLRQAGDGVSFLLYERRQDMRAPVLRPRVALRRFPAVAVAFNFSMGGAALQFAFRQAIRSLTARVGPRPLAEPP